MAKIQIYLEHYDVTESGKIYRLTEHGNAKSEREEVGSLDKRSGYINVSLSASPCKSLFNTAAHRLVALIYVHNPKPDEYNFVNHKDGNPGNNHYTNLEWCTQSMNVKHAHDTGLIICNPTMGESNGMSKITDEQVLEIRAAYIPRKVSYMKLAQQYGVDKSLIYQIVTRKIWRHL